MRGERRLGWSERLLAASLGGVLLLGLAGSGWGAVRANLESPALGQSVAGISVVSGWAFSTTSGATITRVRLRVDGTPVTTIPCCSERADVAAVFGSQALNSGFGLLQNYGLFSPGLHTIGVEVEDSAESSAVIDYSVTVIKPGGFEFLDEFDLSAAVVSREDQTMVVEGIIIRDKASGQSETINVSFRWAENCQCLVMVESAAQTGSSKSVTGQLILGSGAANATFTVHPEMGQIDFSIEATSSTFFLCADVFSIAQGSQKVELTGSVSQVNEDTALISFEGEFNGCDTISQGTVVTGAISEFPAWFDLEAPFQIFYGDSVIAVE